MDNTPKTLKIPDGCSAGKLLALIHKCRGSVYLTGDGFSLCLTSMLCRYVAVERIIKDTGSTQVSLAFTDEKDCEMVEKKLEALIAA